MSGRLVILPKKSYCPWNPKNVERVLRDEQRYLEETKQTQAAQQQSTSKAKWELLKDTQKDRHTAKDDDEAESLKHINLFAQEEQQDLKEKQLLRKEGKTTKPNSNNQTTAHGIVPLYLGQTVDKNERYRFDYKRKEQTSDLEASHAGLSLKELKRKSLMDPMEQFHSLPLEQQQQQFRNQRTATSKREDEGMNMEYVADRSKNGDKNLPRVEEERVTVKSNGSDSSRHRGRKNSKRKSSRKRKQRRKRRHSSRSSSHRKRDASHLSSEEDHSSISSNSHSSSSSSSNSQRDSSDDDSDDDSSLSSMERRKRRRKRRKRSSKRDRGHSKYLERKRKLKRRKREESSTTKDETNKEWDDLRKRRQEREETERQRQQSLLVSQQQQQKQTCYTNQYNPGLTRRHVERK